MSGGRGPTTATAPDLGMRPSPACNCRGTCGFSDSCSIAIRPPAGVRASTIGASGFMHDIDLILTLTGGLAAALVCGYVTFRLGLSPIVGYLLAGLRRRAEHARLRRQQAPGGPVRRGRRHPADVRRRPAIPPQGAARRAAGRPARGPGPEPRRDPARHPGRRRLRVGLVGRHRLRPGDLGGEHRRPHPGPRGQRRPAHPDRAHRRRLAGRRGPLHGLRRWCCCRPSSAGARPGRAGSPPASGSPWSRSPRWSP